MTVSTDPLVGRVLDGRYEITSRVARGGMATVYRAQDRHLMRVVAIKVMHEGLAEEQEFARKFDQEAKAAARLVNPHIVSVFDQGVDGSRPYIVMEYVPGCTLRHVIAQEAPLSPLRAIDMLEPVVSALASAHENGLVHRDIKPENVLISDRGQIKVADFGLARAITTQSVSAGSGLLVGTVSYLPPELVIKDRADERSDVYSTGIVLFEMLTGQKPHTGATPIQVAWAHVNEDVPAPSTWLAEHGGGRGEELASAIPAYLDALVRTCTAREPGERPEDGHALLALLRSVRSSLARGRAEDPAITELVHRAGNAQSASPVPAPARRPGPARPTGTPVSPVDYRPAAPLSTAAPLPRAPRTDIAHQTTPRRPPAHQASPPDRRPRTAARHPGAARPPHAATRTRTTSRPSGQAASRRSAHTASRLSAHTASRRSAHTASRRRRSLVMMLVIAVLAVAVGVLAYRFGVSLRTSSTPTPVTTVVTGQENHARGPA